jgi:release factor glutamine methyltransferase
LIKGDRSVVVVSGLELWQWRQEARSGATEFGVSLEEVDWLLQAVTDVEKLELRLQSFKDRSQIQLQIPLTQLTQLWQRRLQERLPVQYIAGVTPWRNFSLSVSNSVLIPRPETECLIDLAIASRKHTIYCSNTENLETWADLGTGSGAIAIGLAAVLTNATIYAVDTSEAALAIAHQNAHNLGFADRIQFHQGSWFEPLQHLKGQLNGIVSNPPYIPSQIVRELQPEVAHHEPHLALDGGADGLDCIRHLVKLAPDYLQSGGVLLLEMMSGQAPAVRELLKNQGSYQQIGIHQDLAGIDRFALAYRR